MRQNKYISFIYSQITKNNFARNIVLLSSASVLAQLINITSMPLLSRLYSPEDFGVLSLFSSVLGLLSTISGFRYYLVLPLARRERYVHSIVWLSVLLQFSFMLIIIFTVFIGGRYLADTRYAVLYPYRYLVPGGVFAISIYGMSVQWVIREKSFSLIAKTKLTQTLIAFLVKIAGAYAGLRPLGLLLGFVAGQSCGGIKLIRHIIQLKGKPRINFTHIKRSAISYRNMFLIDTPGALLNTAGAYMLPIIIAYYYADDIVGSFSMAQNLLILPGVIIGQSIGQVFSQKAGEARYNGTLASVTGKVFELLARTGLYPVLLCSLFAPDIFDITLGSQWREAGYFASIIAPWVSINFIYSPMSILFTTLMIQRTALVFTSVYTVTRIGSVAFFGGESPLCAMTALSISGTVMMLIGVTLLMYKAGVDKIATRMYRIAFELLIELLPCIAFLFYGKNNLYVGFFSILTSLLVYIYINLKFYKNIRNNKVAITNKTRHRSSR